MDHKATYIWASVGLVIILILAGVTYNSTRLITEKTIENHSSRLPRVPRRQSIYGSPNMYGSSTPRRQPWSR